MYIYNIYNSFLNRSSIHFFLIVESCNVYFNGDFYEHLWILESTNLTIKILQSIIFLFFIELKIRIKN